MSADLGAWMDAVRTGVTDAAPRAGVFAQHVHVLPTTRSTNDDVARAAFEGAPEGYVVIAAEQTAGRGRRGASWHSPAGRGLYLSTLLRPDRWAVVRHEPASPAPALATLMAGVAVASAVHDACGVSVELKWPNDVMVRVERPSAVGPGAWGTTAEPTAAFRASAQSAERPAWRKLAGILAEGASDGGVLRSIVLGLGVNVSRSMAPPDVAARMVALDELLDERLPAVPVAALVSALLTRLREGCDLLARGALAEVRQRWHRLAPSVDGTRVRWHHQGVECTGTTIGIDATGALRVRSGADAELLVHGGDVEWLLRTQDA